MRLVTAVAASALLFSSEGLTQEAITPVHSPTAIAADSALALIDIPIGSFVNDTTAILSGANRELNKTYKVAVGDVVFSEFSYLVTTTAYLRNDLDFTASPKIRHIVPRTAALGFGGTLTLSGFACTSEKHITALINGKPKGGTCFTDKNRDGTFDTIERTSLLSAGKVTLPTPVPYRIQAKLITGIQSRYELLYLGKNGNTLRLAYREYTNEMARPAFTTELTYDVEPGKPTQLRHKDISIAVESVGNDGLTYAITKASL